MNIKFEAPNGWRTEYNDFIIHACLAKGLLFLDRAAVLRRNDDDIICASVTSEELATKDAIEWFNKNGAYCAWFNHRGMEELPFDKVIKVPENYNKELDSFKDSEYE